MSDRERVEQASQPFEELRRAAGLPRQRLSSFSTCRRHATRGSRKRPDQQRLSHDGSGLATTPAARGAMTEVILAKRLHRLAAVPGCRHGAGVASTRSCTLSWAWDGTENSNATGSKPEHDGGIPRQAESLHWRTYDRLRRRPDLAKGAFDDGLDAICG